jgi:ABC-type Na+ efflux pump permease subunit
MIVGGVWPVVQRELRESARRPLNHWLRLLGASAGGLIFCVVSAAREPASFIGNQMFVNIHRLVLFLICALVPALTADCIARERRDGTLGLLFMTPLTASSIVLGKILAQMLRAVTLWLAVLPLLTIPFIYGGITWNDVANFLIVEVCAGIFCLAAGVLASSLTENRAISFVLAFLLVGVFVNGVRQFELARVRTIAVKMAGKQGNVYAYVVQSFEPTAILIGESRVFYANRGFYSVMAAPLSTPLRGAKWQILAENLILALLTLLVSFRFAGWRVERSWQDKIPSERQRNWVKRYCSPLFARWMAGRMRKAKERNPIAWLEQYSWKARLNKWGLCLLFVLLDCYVIDANQVYNIGIMVTALLMVMAAAYTYAGVNGFLQEKRSGALELILVTPLSVKQIIFGRVWGLWKQFLPSVLVVVASDLAVHTMLPIYSFGFYGSNDSGGAWFWIKNIEIVAIYLTLPLIATSFALSARKLFVASALTVAAGFGPAVLLLVISMIENIPTALSFLSFVDWSLIFFVFMIGAHVLVTMFAYRHLRRSLARRSYAF